MNLRDAAAHPLIGYTDPEGAFDEWRDNLARLHP